MRIGIIGDNKGQGGNVSWAKQFALSMKEFDVTVDYITESNLKEDSPLFDFCPQSHINCTTIFSSNIKSPVEVLNKLSFTAQRLYELLRSKIYDAFILQRADYLPVIQSLNLTKKIPIFIANHDIGVWQQILTSSSLTSEAPYRLIELMEFFYKSGIRLNMLSTSKFLGDKFTAFNPNIKSFYLPPALNAKIQTSKPLQMEDTEGILWVGDSASYKNPELMMNIAKMLPDIKMTAIFNTKSKARLTKICNKYKAPNLTVLGAQPIETLIELYQKHRIGLLTSYGETFSIVAQEHQMFHPTFVSTNNINEYQKIYDDNLISFSNAQDFVTQIKEIYNDKNFYNHTVNKTRKYILSNYKKENVKQWYAQLVEQIKEMRFALNPPTKKNTLGSFIDSRLGLLDEISYESVLDSLNYQDNVMGILSILSQLEYYEKVDNKSHTFFKLKK